MGAQKKTLYAVIIIVTLANVTFAREEWVDPYDLNINVRPISREESKEFNNGRTHQCKEKSSYHLRKIINLLIGMTYFDRESEFYTGVINIRLNTADYDFLRNVMSDHLNDEHVLIRLHEVLHKSLEKSIYSTYFFSITKNIFLLINNEKAQLSLIMLVVFYVLWKIQPQNYKLTSLFKLFFPLVYVSDFILRYKGKLEEVEVDQYIQFENYKGCDPSRLGWIDWIYDKFTGSCEKGKRDYLLSQRAAIHIFTPLHIITEQFDIFITVLKHLGTGFGGFMWALIEQMPWYMKPFVGLLSFLLVIFMMLMLGSYTLGINPRFNLLHMLHFECFHQTPPIQNNVNQTNKDTISGDNLKTLLNLKNRRSQCITETNSQKINTPITYKTKQKVSVRRRISKPLSINYEDIDEP